MTAASIRYSIGTTPVSLSRALVAIHQSCSSGLIDRLEPDFQVTSARPPSRLEADTE